MRGKRKTPCTFCNKVRELVGIKPVVLIDKKPPQPNSLKEIEDKTNNENNAQIQAKSHH